MKTYQRVVDISVAAAFFVLALPVEIMVGETGRVTVLGAPAMLLAAVMIALIFSAALAVRRWSPPIALALAWAGAVLQMGLGRPPTAADLAIFGVLYTTAAYGTRRVYWAGFASALTGALVITVYLFLGPPFAGGGFSLRTLPVAVAVLVAAAFALLLAWTIGALVRAALRATANREAQERAEADAAVEQERVRIARDMHDVVAHSLAVVIAQADGARYAAASDPAAATIALTTISKTARSALADVRLLLGQLRHSQGGGPQPTLADLEALYAQVRGSGVDLRVTVDPAPASEAPGGAQLAVYRILQEALTNALRHGDGPVDVRLAWHSDRVELEVRNPLRGLAPAASASGPVRTEASGQPRSAGHGIIGMRERAQLAGGQLTAGDSGGEFVVSAVLPLRGDA
jgi:signal transduction histidine kinase